MLRTFKGRYILIVDDDPHVAKALVRHLTKREYKVASASNGEEALKMIEKEQPNLVLLDALMPGMDGIEVLEQIRARFPNIDVVMISALKEEVVANEAIKMGAYEWLPKPFSLEHLETTICVTMLRRITEEPSLS